MGRGFFGHGNNVSGLGSHVSVKTENASKVAGSLGLRRAWNGGTYIIHRGSGVLTCVVITYTAEQIFS